MNSSPNQDDNVALQGDLSVITIEDLMQLVADADLYGELQITAPTNAAILFVQKGTLIYSHLHRNPFKIGQRLLQGNYITSKQLQECLDLYRSSPSNSRIGKLLVERNYLKQEELVRVHKEQSKAIFFEILSWQVGSFAFLVKEIPQNEDIYLQERIDHLTLEGVLQKDERNTPNDETYLDTGFNEKFAFGNQ